MELLRSLSRLFRRDAREPRHVCAECGEPVRDRFDREASQSAAAEHMTRNPGAKIDFAEPVPLCERCQGAWDEACKDILGPIDVTQPSRLIVHDAGPDGSSTYELVIGRDIDRGLAEKLISSNGGTDVYTLHVYEAGERLENFVSKDTYRLVKETMDGIPPVRTAEENVAAINQLIASAKAKSRDSGL